MPTSIHMFYALVHKDDRSAWGVTFPDMPGCFSAADTEQDIRPNAAQAIRLWFEGSSMIVPRTLGEIADQVSEQLAAGAMLIAIPVMGLD